MIIHNDREYWIDAVRTFACLCVITTHAPMPNGSSGEETIAFFNYYSMCGASILFFMISGALVLYRERPVTSFIKKRISRIVFPMVIWSIISLFVDFCLGEIGGEDFIRKVVLIPFIPQVGTYWFIYVIFGIYLVTPILSSWLNRCKQSDTLLYLGIWGITLLIPYLKLLDENLHSMVSYTSGALYYFYGFLGFAVLGFYIRRYVNIDKFQIKHFVILFIVMACPWLLYLFKCIPHDVIQGRTTINAAAMAICYFLIIKHLKLSKRINNIFYDFAQHSFGIYLVHILIMRKFLWPLFWEYNIPYIVQIPLITLFTAIISYMLVHALSKLPYSKYIVGL